MMYGNYGYGYHMGGLGIFGGVLEFVFWVLVIVLIIKLIRHALGHGKHGRFGGCGGGMCGHGMHHDMHHGMYGDRAMFTLRERYAKGEIEKEEFEQKKKDLEL